jgi:hypothetical protein
MIKAKGYFDPQVYERMAQIQAQNAMQQGNIRANAQQQNAQLFANLLPQLAQIYGQYQQKQEIAGQKQAATDYFTGNVSNAPTMQPQQQGFESQPYSTRDWMDVPVPVQQRANVPNAIMPTPTITPRSQDPQRLFAATMQQENPYLQQAGQQGIQNFMAQQPKYAEFAPGSQIEDVGAFSPTKGQTRQIPFKPTTTKEEEPKLPVGFAQITDPARKAQIWNDVYGGNMTEKDFKEVQERPYFQPITDREGKVHIFDSRTGKVVDKAELIKPAPTEVRQQVVAFNDNLNTVKEIKKIVNTGDLTGVVKGRARKIGTKFFSDKEAQTLTNRLAQLRTIIYGLSGKQINESEQKWLDEEILPQMRQPTENFEVTLDEFERWITRRKGALIEQFPNVKDNGSGLTPTEGVDLKSKYGLE